MLDDDDLGRVAELLQPVSPIQPDEPIPPIQLEEAIIDHNLVNLPEPMEIEEEGGGGRREEEERKEEGGGRMEEEGGRRVEEGERRVEETLEMNEEGGRREDGTEKREEEGGRTEELEKREEAGLDLGREERKEEEKEEEVLPPLQAGINFEDLGLPSNFLAMHNIDESYFNSITVEMQNDIILQHIPLEAPSQIPSSQVNNNAPPPSANLPPPASFIPPDTQLEDFLAALPEALRMEVLNDQLNEQRNVPSEIDNETFLVSLTNELRAEVLLTATPEFLLTLPSPYREEAERLRAQENLRFFGRREGGGGRREAGGGRREIVGREEGVRREGGRREEEGLIRDKALMTKLGGVDERTIENLLGGLYGEVKDFGRIDLGLLGSLAKNTGNLAKLLDFLLFLLKNPRLEEIGRDRMEEEGGRREEEGGRMEEEGVKKKEEEVKRVEEGRSREE